MIYTFIFISLLLAVPTIIIADDSSVGADYEYSDYKKLIDAAKKNERHKGEIIDPDNMHSIYGSDEADKKSSRLKEAPGGSDPLNDSEESLVGAKERNDKIALDIKTAEQAAAEKAAAEKAAAEQAAADMGHKNKNKGSGGGDYYFPPSANNGKSKRVEMVSNTVERKNKILFGIRLGTEFNVYLPKTANNIQPGLVKLTVLSDVPGDHESLSSGSEIFGVPSVSKGSSNLYITLVRGITPDGKEFDMNGYVYNVSGSPGLAGVVKSDGKVLNRSFVEGGAVLGGSLIGALTGSDMVGEAVNATAGNLLDESKSIAKGKAGGPLLIIESAPQDAVVIVGETF